MSRKHRIWFPGAIYHITARGNRRMNIFMEDNDFITYLKILEDVRQQYPFILHSYCLMNNHLHLQLETISHHIKIIMKEIHSRYAVYLNRKLRMVGHVFQGRYGASLIQENDYFLEASRYIHRNPLEANMVKCLSDYAWSSYPAYIHLSHRNPHIETSKVLSFFKEPVHESYKKYVETPIKSKEEKSCPQTSQVLP
ncbi:transposase [Falsibacillus pallidus]|uniref:transposase n=1 Tax=Falsibacillus pallidus TaxID=493781 RepID=UPI003D96B460